MANLNESQQELMILYEANAQRWWLLQRHAAGQYRQRCGSVAEGKPHLILDPAEKIKGLFIYYVLDSERANRVCRHRRW